MLQVCLLLEILSRSFFKFFKYIISFEVPKSLLMSIIRFMNKIGDNEISEHTFLLLIHCYMAWVREGY